jgi:hypothetical protein
MTHGNYTVIYQNRIVRPNPAVGLPIDHEFLTPNQHIGVPAWSEPVHRVLFLLGQGNTHAVTVSNYYLVRAHRRFDAA